MNKAIYLFLFILISLTSCENDSIRGSRKMITKSYDYTDFTKVDVSNSISVKISQGKSYKIELSCNENILEFIDIHLEGKTLNLEMNGLHNYRDITVKVTITVPNIEKIKARGASKVKMSDFKLDHLKLDLSGASTFKGKVVINEIIEVEASGASTVKIKGKAENANFEISGASSLNAKYFEVTKKLSTDASGASSCSVFSKGTLEMESSGASSIEYYGKGKVIKNEESGAGSIEKMYQI